MVCGAKCVLAAKSLVVNLSINKPCLSKFILLFCFHKAYKRIHFLWTDLQMLWILAQVLLPIECVCMVDAQIQLPTDNVFMIQERVLLIHDNVFMVQERVLLLLEYV